LRVWPAEKVEKYILHAPEIECPQPPSDSPTPGASVSGDQPFRILGMAEDGYAYFLDFSERIYRTKLESLSKGSLKRLAPLAYWRREFSPRMTNEDWDEATGWVIENTIHKDFETKNILGRGAWKNEDGSFCYWDGKELTGQADSDKIFERKKQKNLHITGDTAPPELRQEIAALVERMNFETKADAIYFLSWCALSPFSGVLTYRPPLLITGPAGVGKSTIFERISRPLAHGLELTAKESSPAGCRQENGNDSGAITIEEADTIDADSERNRKGFLSLMRVSFCETAPDAYKGTPGHKAVSFKMKNMFMFISISPVVDDTADSDRLFYVNLEDKKNNWEEIEKEIERLITEENCRMIRATTWKNLKKIIALSKVAKKIIQKKTGLSSRRSHAEGLLTAAYHMIWMGKADDDLDALRALIDELYTEKTEIETRDQADELITRILDEAVPVKGYNDRMTLREIIQAISTGRVKTGNDTDINGEDILAGKDIQNLKNIAGRYGLKVIEDTFLAIANNHHALKKIIDMGQGYHRHFWRHCGCAEKSKNIYIAGKTRRCTVLAGVIEDRPF